MEAEVGKRSGSAYQKELVHRGLLYAAIKSRPKSLKSGRVEDLRRFSCPAVIFMIGAAHQSAVPLSLSFYDAHSYLNTKSAGGITSERLFLSFDMCVGCGA